MHPYNHLVPYSNASILIVMVVCQIICSGTLTSFKVSRGVVAKLSEMFWVPDKRVRIFVDICCTLEIVFLSWNFGGWDIFVCLF